MNERRGGCLCGQVRYLLIGDPVKSRICWCSDCQRIAGNGTVNALFPSAAIEISGSPAVFVRRAPNGNPARRRFCANCGCHLFADTPGYADVIVVRVGTLDDPSSIQPSANIWSASAPAWACLDSELERVERQPPPAPSPT
jgi:hypothetical protein